MAAQQAAAQQQATYAHLREQGVIVQAAPDGSFRSVRVPPTPDESTEQIKILDQQIALQVAKIARLEGGGETPNHPYMIEAKAQLQALEAARREAQIKAKQDFVKDVRRWVTLYGEIANSSAHVVAANRRLARDQQALKLLTMVIQTGKRLHPK